MTKGISIWTLPGGLENELTIDKALEQAEQAGFQALELGIDTQGVLNTESTESHCREILAKCEASPLAVETLASGMSWGANPLSEDPEVRKKSLQNHGAALERAGWLGLHAYLYVPGVVNSPIAPDEHVAYTDAVDRCRLNVEELLKTAESSGVDLCLENVWNGLFLSPLELADFIDSFGSDRLGVYFDVGNILRYHQDPADWIKTLGHRIKRVHIKDFRETFGWSGTYAFARLGEGNVDWASVMAALHEIKYDKTVIAEMLPPEGDLAEHTSQAMDKILKLG
jgi:hexulose-6-phosphate isomerase